MDNIITSCHEGEIPAMLQRVKTLHSNLKFTFELPTENGIAFLDMRLKQVGKVVHHSWYQKPTDTGVLMNFHARSPEKYKQSLVAGFVNRIWQTCSDYFTLEDNIRIFKEMLENYQYSPSFYNRIIRKSLNRLLDPLSRIKKPSND